MLDRKNIYLFGVCYIQVLLVTINIWQITHSEYIGMFIVGFLISFLWTVNVKTIAVSTFENRIFYSLGGACGCISGSLLSSYIYDILNFLYQY